MTKKQKKPRHQFVVRIFDDLYKWVVEKAEERKVSKNIVITECIKRSIDYEINARKMKEKYHRKKNKDFEP